MEHDRSRQPRLIVMELRRLLDDSDHDSNEIRKLFDKAIPRCSPDCRRYLERSAKWFDGGRLMDAKRALTNALRMFLGGD